MRTEDAVRLLENHRDQNIAVATLCELAKNLERPALIIQKASDSNLQDHQYSEVRGRELVECVLRLAAGFRQRGYRPGQRAVIMQPPGVNFFVLTFACFLYGLIPIFIDPGMDKRSLRLSIRRSKPDLFMGVFKAHLARWVLRLCPASLQESVLTEERRTFPGTVNLRKLYADQISQSDLDSFSQSIQSRRSEDMAALLYTSGSTGPAKGAVYTHKMFLAQVQAIRDMFQITRDDVDLATFPLFALFAPALGMRALVPDMDFRKPAQVQADVIFDAVQKYNVSNFFGSPALLKRLSEHAASVGPRLNSLRRVISAGAPVSYKLIAKFKSMLPETCQLFTPYGATECMPVAWINGDEVLAIQDRIRSGKGIPVGRVNPGLDLRIIAIQDKAIKDWDESLRVKPGQVGEIIVSGPVVSSQYLDQPEADAVHKIHEAATGKLFHRIGDLGYFDADSCLWFCGRKSQRVDLSDSTTLYTVCIEALFNEHPSVLRSALASLNPGPGMAAKPVLWVELYDKKMPRAKQALLLSELKTMAATHPQAKHIAHFLIHPAFPVDTRHNAKIFRERLGLKAASILKWRTH